MVLRFNHVRGGYTLFFLTCAVTAQAQYYLGPSTFVSKLPKVATYRYGLSGRCERDFGRRYSVFTSVLFAIPRRTSYDFLTGPNGILSIGMAPNSRFEGTSTEWLSGLDLGTTLAVARPELFVKKAIYT
jgi:hypothetical protein